MISETERKERTLILAESKPVKLSAVSDLYSTLDLNTSRPRQRPTTVGDDGWVTSVSMTSFRSFQDSGKLNLALPEVGHSLDHHFESTPSLAGAKTQRPPAREGRPALPQMPHPPKTPIGTPSSRSPRNAETHVRQPSPTSSLRCSLAVGSTIPVIH